jgi:hypothetical protein
MKKEMIIILALLFIPFVLASNIQQVNYTNTPSGSSNNANLVVQVLKYEPYPVNAGDWFDLWVKVQNIGQNDANNVRFELQPDYPFSSNDSLIQDYGLIYGTQNAYKVDQTYDSSQVILKYRIKVADNAPEGTSSLKLVTTANKNNPSEASTVNSLSIVIAKTKTDFDVKLRDINPQESSFTVTNIGDEPAKAIVVDVKNQEGVNFLSGAEPASLGDLNQGEFTIAHLKAIPLQTSSNITLVISYTDKAGVRNTIEKTVSLNSLMLQNTCISDSGSIFSKYIYALIGLVTGMFLIILISLIRHKKKHSVK